MTVEKDHAAQTQHHHDDVAILSMLVATTLL